MTSDISPKIKEAAPSILAEIEKAKSVLLHCHPSPDPDTVGSSLAMKEALEGMGKKVTLIKGDSEIPQAYAQFPGASSIVMKNFFEIDLSQFDLFIIIDSGSPEQISRFKPITLPLPIRSIVIDHHKTNAGFGDIDLIEGTYPAAAQILFDLFRLWGVKMTEGIATNLFMAIYTDTGGFKYESTGERTFEVAAELSRLAPGFPKAISIMENSNRPKDVYALGLALGSIQTFLGGRLAISAVPNDVLVKNELGADDVSAGEAVTFMRTVAEWDIVVSIFEAEPGKLRVSFRSKDDRYDVAKLAAEIGGGGHKMAAGAAVAGQTIDEVKAKIVEKAGEMMG